MLRIRTHKNFNEKESCIRSQAHFLAESRMETSQYSGVAGWMLILWCCCCCCWSSIFIIFLIVNYYWVGSGWSHLKIVKDGWGKWGINSRSINNAGSSQLNSVSSRSDCSYTLVSVYWRTNTGEHFFSHFKSSLLVGSYGNSRQVIVQEFLSSGQQQRPSCRRNFLGADCKVFIYIIYAQNYSIRTKV